MISSVCVAVLIVAMVIDVTKAQLCAGCLWGNECVAPGGKKMYSQCIEWRCTEPRAGYYTGSYYVLGCPYNNTCVPSGTSVPSDYPCTNYECYTIGGGLGARYITTGCKFNNDCVPPGENRTTSQNCQLFTCEQTEMGLQSDYKYTGCAYNGTCINPGDSVPTDKLCQLFSCVQDGDSINGDIKYTGCEDNGECHDIDGAHWQTRGTVGCLTKSCTLSGSIVTTNIERFECEVTDAGGNTICLADGEESDNDCEKLTCQITQLADGTLRASTIGTINGCTDNDGNCVAFGDIWVDKNRDICETKVCGETEPTEIACLSRDNDCHVFGSPPWGEYRLDGQCRSYRCSPHGDHWAVAEDVGEACSFREGGCKAPGQTFIQVYASDCKERSCQWTDLRGSHNGNKVFEIIGCTDAYGNCHPVGSFPIPKRMGGALETSVICSWDISNTSIEYFVVQE